MKISICATREELDTRADLLIAHIRELSDAGAGDDQELKKAARLSIKDHPKVAVTQLRRRWVTGYRDQMAEMNRDIEAFLARLVEGKIGQATSELPPIG